MRLLDWGAAGARSAAAAAGGRESRRARPRGNTPQNRQGPPGTAR
ncbi:hypothetical protein PSMK_14370 [Phycisphaera mikurensis NBRC 102666]|uniref:Uncharacterized protein n=1 Tax=Phycisphaera mikurensis (strain NBRC 102666 / KCTC 22515 / FYK2301M01) TaxID=1142394 RepID=I0IEA8_PHYMF|nr:hypothetical protein PSMK_14370 [Phycisphaera mikurensis NBRC 102666]